MELALGEREAALARQPAVQARHALTLAMGYAPHPLVQVFDGEVVGAWRKFSIGRRADVHDHRAGPAPQAQRGQEGALVRDSDAHRPAIFRCPDIATASVVTLENLHDADLRSGRGGAVDDAGRGRHDRRRDRSRTQRRRSFASRRTKATTTSLGASRRKTAGRCWSSTTARSAGICCGSRRRSINLQPDVHAGVRPFADRLLTARLEGRADRNRRRLRVGADDQDDVRRHARVGTGIG